MMSRTWRTEYPRINLAEPPVRAALERYLTYVGAAIERLGELDRQATHSGDPSISA
jgi:hypothetical protein